MRLNDLAKKDNTWKNRAVSLLMAGTMVLGSLWIGPSKYTEAAEDEGVGVLTLSELPEYTLTKTTLNGALIVDDSGRTCEATELSKIVIQGTSDAQPSVEITGEVGNASTVVEITGDYASLQVKSGGTLNAASVQGYLAYNYGTVNAGTLNLSVSGAEKEFGNEGKLTVTGDLSIDSSMGTLENTGEIHANGLNLNSTFTLNNSSTGSIEINSLSLYENGEDYAEIVNEGSIAIPAFNSSAFPEQAFTNKGTVTCDDAALTTQVLNYSSAVYDVKDSYSMSGFNSEPPWTVKAQPMTTITMDGGGFDLIVGTNDSVSVSGNYENRYAFEFLEELNYSLLSEFEQVDGNDYLKVTGLSNGRYVKDKLTFTPKEGYLTMCSHSAPYSFAESFDLKKSDIYIDNPGGTPFYNQDVMVSIADKSTGKHVTADLISAVPSLEDTYQNLVFDDTPPQVFITSAKADGQDIAIDTGDDDVEITARQLVLQLDILDENLDMTAEVNEEEVTIQDGATADDPKTLTITYDTDPEELEDNLSYTIRDLAGNETHFSIHLVYAQETTTGTFSVDDIAVGEAPTLSLSTTPEDIDEVIYEIKLKSAADSEYQAYEEETPIDAAGVYTIRATIEETGRYTGLVKTADFTVSRLSGTGEISIPSTITYGTEYAPTVITESTGMVTFAYKPSGTPEDAYTVTKPVFAGTYDVRATVSETDTYEGFECYGTFTIKKKVVTATVTAADVTIGETPNPQVTTDSDGTVTFRYKSDAAGAEYSDTVPTAAGKYYVEATVAATDGYESIVCESAATFTIKKKVVTATVSVADVTIGETIDPQVTTDSDGTVTFRYKSDAAGAEYSATVPTAAGKYYVEATVAETDTYESIVCESATPFTIKKKAVTATVTVSDVTIGETIDPQVTTDSDGTVTFRYKSDAAGAEYSDTVPTAAGKYYVEATVAETDTYESIICESATTFTIKKKVVTATVTVADVTIGETIDPQVMTDSDGAITYAYKSAGAPDTAYSDTVPTGAGSYMVRATIAETDVYESIQCYTAEAFQILRKTDAATITVADITIGETPNPQVTTDSDGAITFEYKPAGDPDTAYSDTVPTAAGQYDVRATIAQTDTYDTITCVTATPFTIKKKVVTATVTVADVTIGETPNPQVTTDSDGAIIYAYKSAGAPDTAYSDTVPTGAGSYMVRATVAETDVYEAIQCYTAEAFQILRKTDAATITVADITIGETPNPQVTTDSDGAITFEYKPAGDPDTAYSDTVPTAAGQYDVRATIAQTDTYDAITCETTTPFTIKKKVVTATVTVADVTIGETPNPQVTTDSDGAITYAYKSAGAPDTAYSDTVPTVAGQYDVRATIGETDTYDAITCVTTTPFTIKKKAVTATVTVADVTIGETIDPQVTTDSDGTVTFRYKSDAAGAEYSATVPTAAGKYYVEATVAETDTYESIVCESATPFTIKKKVVTATVTVADVTIGETPNPQVTTDSDGTVTFRYKSDAAGAEYSDTVPTAAGKYYVEATVAETDTYESIICESATTFTIKKKVVTATVTVADVTIGETPNPQVTTDSDGTVTFRYKSDAAGAEYSDTVPTAAGKYYVEATVAETDTYESIVCESAAAFTIKKKVVAATVTVADVTIGETIDPQVTTVSDGAITYAYKSAGAPDTAYSDTVPTGAGSYMVRATVAETDVYEAIQCYTAEAFQILRKTDAATITVADITIGETPNPQVTTDSDGAITFEYKPAGDPDTAYSDTVPTAAGQYDVRANIGETDTYDAITCVTTTPFTIKKKVVTATVSVADVTIGETPNPQVTTDSDGTVTFRYKSDAAGAEYSDTVPTAAGKYYIEATVAETDTYESIICESATTFTIKKKVVTATVSVADVTIGETPNPQVTTDSDGAITFEYKPAGDPDTAYSDTVPTAAGQYDVRATIAQTDTYDAITCETTTPFTIKKKVVTATVTVVDVTIGETPNPQVTTDSDGTVTFRYKSDAAGAEYSDTVPTAAGKYYVEATVAETDTYESIVCESTSPFTIKKKIATATLTVNDITIGETIDPQVTTDSNGTVTFRYKSDAAGAEYSATVPTAAGTYYAQAIISETDEYEAITCISKAFTISKKTPATATVTVADILVGETPDPQVTTDSNGTVTFKYKSDAEGAKYTATVPTAAGTYYVQATIAETDEYDSITCVSAAFTLSKKTPATATVTVADILVGETPDPQVTTDSNGTVTFRYKSDAEGAKYTATVPTAAGTYYVQAIIAETDEYDSITCTSEAFKISRKTVTATVTVADVEIGETITPVVTTESDGKNTATFLYKPADAPETAYSSTVPVQSGRYSVKAIIPETDTYNSIVCEGTFKIRKKTPSYATVTVPNVQVGQTVEATVDTDSDGKKDAKLEFKAYDAPDSGYDQLYPIAVGRYSVRATIPETENYEAIVCENSFYITAKPVAAASVTVADIEVGGRILPKLTTEHDGKNLATYQYKQVMAAEASYTTTEPAAADIYMLRVIIPETTNYAETICECRFTIYKKNATASVSVADLLVGETVTPKVTTGSDGTPTFEYKEADAADAAYSSTVPAAAGKYSVRATISETETYHEVTCENTFTISKRTAKVTVNAADILVGEKVKPVVDTDSDGAAAFEYKVEGAEDTTFTDVIPTAAGTYVIRATIAETETYKKAVGRGTFIIGKHKPVSAKVTAADILVGETVNPEVTSDSDGAADATFVYKASGAADSTFSTSVPTTAGSYVVRATVPETARYLSITCEGSFTVRRKKAEVRVSLDNPYAGTTYSPKVTTESNGTVTYEYRTNTENSQFSLTQPKSVGRYIVRVTVAQTDMYEAVSGEAEYEVIFLDEPQTPYSVAGTEGKNNYYTEDVTLDAPEGYLISATPDGEYTTSIPYVEGMTKVYLKRIDDDALTDEIRLGEILIDKEAPVLEGIITDKNNPVTYTEGAEIYADTLKISLVDKNLAYVWVGNFGAAVTDGRADIVLSANGDYKTYTITAEDIAGNTYKLTFTLLAVWRLSDEVPPGMSVTLETGKRYTFGDGNWKVEGEATIYSGGQAFYVTKSRKYTLSQE